MIRFEWDKEKAKANEKKHGVTFEEASTVFDDPYAVFIEDRVVDGEQRWHVIGMSTGMLVLLVAHTLRLDRNEASEIARIISARQTTRKEQKLYGENHS